MREIWKSVKGYEGLYEVSNTGNVKSLSKNKILNPCLHKKGYMFVTLTKNKKTKHKYVHRLVADAFIENKLLKTQVNHIDGNKTNNKVENLEWCTDEENTKHAYESGLREMKVCVEVEMFSCEGEIISKFNSMSEASRKTGINMGNISRCCNGHCKTAGGYVWKKVE